MKSLLFLFIAFLSVGIARSQSVTGYVTDKEGNPLSGVTVIERKKTNGTTTDNEGKFSIIVKPNSVLVLSGVGFLPKEVRVDNQTTIHVVMERFDAAMDEVVVVGYGTQKKINLTGAVAQVSGEVLENRPAPNVTRLLQGTLPNLNIKMVDGNPTRSASYNIRGATSIGAGGSALVLIDGVEGDPNLLNPGDVESVSILKDASSAAIYGSRAAFGVVLITTKSARNKKVQLDVAVSQSINKRTVVPDLVSNGYEWAKNFDDAFFGWYDYKTHAISVNSIFPFSLDYLDRLKQHDEDPSLPKVEYNQALNRYEYFGNTDWFDVLHKKTMPATDASVSVSGGTDKVDYYLSGRYYSQDGIFNYSSDKFKRYNLRAKGSVNFTSWLQFQNNLDLSTYTYGYPLLANGDGNIWRYLDVQGFPMSTLYNPDGTYSYNGAFTVAPFAEGSSRSDQQSFYTRNTAALVAKPIKNLLTIKAELTYAKRFDKDIRKNNYVEYSTSPDRIDRYGQSLLRQGNSENSYWVTNITAEAKKDFRDHHVKLLLGYNAENSTTNNLDVSRDGILVPDKPDFNLTDGLNYSIRGGGTEWAYMGAFYRMNYDYQGKYLVEFNGRYDGSSKFPSNQRYGFFPSVSAGWNVARENFMQSTSGWLNNLKLRSSFGSLGNGNVAPYRYLETMSINKMSVILDGVQNNYTSFPGVIPAGLTWERSTTFNVGADIGLLSNRLNLSYDWYNRKTTDMFTQGTPLPNVFGASEPFGNYADLSTKGWELTLGWKDRIMLGNRNLDYSISGSLWDSRSFITKFNNPQKVLSSYYVGQEIGEIWGFVTEGFFQSKDEIQKHADQSYFRNSNNNILLPGDLKFADLNGDGKINIGANSVSNPGDRKIIGNNAPRYQYGFTLSANWSGIGISAFFQGIAKRDWYFAPEADLFYGPYNRPYGFQPKKMMNDIWTEENPNAYFPRYRGYIALGTTRSLGAPQTGYLQDASYMRLKNIMIDYSLPSAVLKRLHAKAAKIYVSGQNLLTFSGLYKHTDNFDPEIIENPVGDMTNGYGQGDAYPMLKTLTVGLNLSF